MEVIRILVVEDSPLVATILKGLLGSDPDLLVVGVARDGEEALRLIPRVKPDLITMDLYMPGMNGVEATRRIMIEYPTPILILASALTGEKKVEAFQAMAYGALDLIGKDLYNGDEIDETTRKTLIDKIKHLARVTVSRRSPTLIPKTSPLSRKPLRSAEGTTQIPRRDTSEKLIGIVSSTGGPAILAALFSKLPADFPAPIAVVQHVMPDFCAGLVAWLNEQTPLSVKLATDNDLLRAGNIYLAPPDIHMGLNSFHRVQLRQGPPLEFVKPSGTLLLNSIAENYRSLGMGIVLTGLGVDGALGLKAMRDAGGYTIAQDEASSVACWMPREAVRLGAASCVVPADEIADKMIGWVKQK
ncbi:MAG: chemotaxis-specific protein-glutamate methyltransferase CheB [Deltaproteobacteria bacterium]|nr:chemotaxis-specific protein-glutamate methyltransferase CheB [Deltaproteobacteria bacterium]